MIGCRKNNIGLGMGLHACEWGVIDGICMGRMMSDGYEYESF